jgi:hypothetical protein
MKLIFSITLFLTVYFTSFSQDFSQRAIKCEVKFLDDGNGLKEQRNSTIEFLKNKKTKRDEIKLTIDRIMRNVSLSHVESIDSDTLRFEGEKFSVDTDNPLPKGEEDKMLIENLVKFTGKTIIFKENANGLFVGPKVGAGNLNIENMFYTRLPALNKNNFFSPIILNINPILNSKVDTVISETYQGVFITTYNKLQNGFGISGRFIPLKTSNSENDPNFASTIYEFFNYDGKIKSNERSIELMELSIHTKSRTVFKTIQLDEAREEKYKIIIKNY